VPERFIEYMALDELEPAPRNPKDHARDAINASLDRFGFTEPIMLDERTGRMVAGHGRRAKLLEKLAAGESAPDGIIDRDGRWFVPVVRGWASRSDDDAEAYLVASNRLVELGGWYADELASLLSDLAQTPGGLNGTGYDDSTLDGLLGQLGSETDVVTLGEPEPQEPTINLAARFLVPPFSVLDARQGYWQARKREWLALGIRSEVGRPRNLLGMSEQARTGYQQPTRSTATAFDDPQFWYKKRLAERRVGRSLTTREFVEEHYEGPDAYYEGTSVFDPVLCELAYRWWCPPGGRVLDPFAGGSVRGIVAGKLGLGYLGVELRPEQIAANEEQRVVILGDHAPVSWIEGDSEDVIPSLDKWGVTEPFHFLFSCPPCYDLERYSDDPRDLSNMSWPAFVEKYRAIIKASVDRMEDDSFACFVVGEIRDNAGINRAFVPETIGAFARAGAAYYNEAILVTPIGALALRAARIFNGARKLGRAHQTVLVFVKGDPQRAADKLGELQLPDPAELFPHLSPDAAFEPGAFDSAEDDTEP
jgi:hypothetical protein